MLESGSEEGPEHANGVQLGVRGPSGWAAPAALPGGPGDGEGAWTVWAGQRKTRLADCCGDHDHNKFTLEI